MVKIVLSGTQKDVEELAKEMLNNCTEPYKVVAVGKSKKVLTKYKKVLKLRLKGGK